MCIRDRDGDCPAGQLCAANACGPCASDDQCTGSPRYGAGTICVAGGCAVGDCHSNADCGGGICGVDTANTCGNCLNDGQCQSSYGATFMCETATGHCISNSCGSVGACSANPADFCCNSTCVPGNCCQTADCAGLGPTFACQSNTCAVCPAATGDQYYVDPVNGSDTAGTGSGTSAACAFKTIKAAVALLGTTAPLNTQIIVKNTGVVSAGETFPIVPPANSRIMGESGQVVIQLAAGQFAFNLTRTNTGVSGFSIDGLIAGVRSALRGIQAQADPTFVENVTVKNMTDDGIRAQSGANLTVGPNVLSTLNGSTTTVKSGLRATGSGRITVTVPAGAAPTVFSFNTQSGINVDATASCSINGVPGLDGTGTVVSTANDFHGMQISQTPGGSGLVNNVTGFVSWGNGIPTSSGGSGLRVLAGSKLVLRNSVLLGNLHHGVVVSPNTSANPSTDISTIDLGSIAGGNGGNIVQTDANPNQDSGICLTLPSPVAPAVSQTLQARGNIFAGPVDCAVGGTLTKTSSCTNATNLGVTSAVQSIDVANCTY